MLIRLSEKMGTRYIIDSLSTRFTRVMDEAVKAGDTVDLAGCRFGQSVVDIIERYYDSIDIINSEEPELDKLLKNNKKAYSLQFEQYPTLVLPSEIDVHTFAEMSKIVETGTKWRFSLPSSNKQTALIVLLIMNYPNIEWDIDSCSKSIYDFVVNEWKPFANPHDEYIEFMYPGFMHVYKDKKGKIGTIYTQPIFENRYVDTHDVLPVEFGTKKLLEFDKNGKPTGEWGRVVAKCVTTITRGKRHNRTLFDLLEFRE